MPKYAKLRGDLVSSRSVVNGQPVYTLKDPITERYYRLREPEFWLINRLDGKSSPEDIAEKFKKKFKLNIGAEDVRQFIETLEEFLFLENSRSEQSLSRASYRAAAKPSLASRIFFLKLKVFNPEKLIDWLVALYRPFHRRIWFIVQVLVIAIGLSLLWANVGQFRVDIGSFLNASSMAAIILSLFILISLHELAHGVMCRYYGGRVTDVGFLLMYFQPCFYCNVSDAWLFEKKSQRLAVTWAGPYFQLILLSMAVIVWRLTVPGTVVNLLARMIVIVSWLSYLFNFNPLIKLDGYYLLSDWLDIPNLRRKSFAYFGNAVKRRVLNWPIEPLSVTRREKRIFLIYAIFALLYTGFLIAYVLFLVGRFLAASLGGVGLLLLLAVLILIFRQAVTALACGTVQHLVYMKQILKRPLRLASYLIVFVLVLVVGLAVPFPHRVSGEVVVQPISSFTLLLNQFGLLESNLRHGGELPENKSSFLQMTANDMAVLGLVPLVHDGQYVSPGDTVAVLTSNQITREIVGGQAELDRLEEELKLLRAPPKREEIAEATAQVNAARANYDQLVRDSERIEKLVEKNLDTPEKLEAARAAVDIARAELANKTSSLELLESPPRPEEEAVLSHMIQKQKAYLDYLREQAKAQHIIAPIGGIVHARTTDDEILKISDNHVVELMVPVSDFDITLIDIGQQVKVKVRSYPERTFSGMVIRIPKAVEVYGEETSFPVSVVVDNSDGLLCAGMSGYAKIDVGESSLASLSARKLTSLLRVEFWSWW